MNVKAEGKRIQKELLDAFEAWYAMKYTADGLQSDDDDVLDYGEQFDRLEKKKVIDNDPDSLAFFNAQKSMRNSMRRDMGKISLAMKKKRHISQRK